MNTAPEGAAVPRVRLTHDAYVTLTEWQAATLRRTGVKPTYSGLVDALVRLVAGHGLDVPGALAVPPVAAS